MSISKTLTGVPYGETTSDLQIGEYVRWNLSHHRSQEQTVKYTKRLPPILRVSGFDQEHHLILEDPTTGKRIVDKEAYHDIGFFHYRFVRNEFLTAAKRAIEDAQD